MQSLLAPAHGNVLLEFLLLNILWSLEERVVVLDQVEVVVQAASAQEQDLASPLVQFTRSR
jgi:hypothetical protein